MHCRLIRFEYENSLNSSAASEYIQYLTAVCSVFTFFLSLQNKYTNWYFRFWQVKSSHATFSFGTLAGVMMCVPHKTPINFCLRLLHPTIWQLSSMSVWTTFRCLYSSSWNFHAQYPPYSQQPTANSVPHHTKPCDGKPSLNSINLKHSQKKSKLVFMWQLVDLCFYHEAFCANLFFPLKTQCHFLKTFSSCQRLEPEVVALLQYSLNTGCSLPPTTVN